MVVGFWFWFFFVRRAVSPRRCGASGLTASRQSVVAQKEIELGAN
jgi:hypothetical protein